MSDKPSVVAALSSVMEDVQSVRKTDRNIQQNYSFRGIDAVVNAVGPALRKHGVIVVPVETSYEVEHYQTSKGTPMRGVTVTVRFRFYGPAADFVEATVCGEAADSGDKATPKAHSVAYRTLLLQALCIPTDDPDPDAESHARSTEQVAQAAKTDGQKPSQSQHAKLNAMLKEAEGDPDRFGLSPNGYESWTDWCKAYVVSEFGKQSRADLTRKEMSQLIDALTTELAPF